jgi:hypothetical protein
MFPSGDVELTRISIFVNGDYLKKIEYLKKGKFVLAETFRIF